MSTREDSETAETVSEPEAHALPPDTPAPRVVVGRRRADGANRRTAPPAGRRVRVEGLNAWYGERHAIKELSLDFPPNQATALIGPSGSGKSTVVRCINRMHEELPRARAQGRVLLDDQDVYDDGIDVVAVRRAIGMLFQ
ncbi:MAG: ATP-binding cassette domain-containing protein, partial [Actinomycetota bacterium]|nr:ATP-binding cassette domain-containing protein [Actinomycetota bacterium]